MSMAIFYPASWLHLLFCIYMVQLPPISARFLLIVFFPLGGAVMLEKEKKVVHSLIPALNPDPFP